MIGYNVTIDHRLIDSTRAKGQYGSWSDEYLNSIHSFITKTEFGGVPDVTSTIELKEGDGAIVVWVEWTTGDSFGSAGGGSFDVIGIFKDLASALSLKEQILNCKGKFEYDYETPDGQKFHGYKGWSGHFESLDDVHISPVILHKDN